MSAVSRPTYVSFYFSEKKEPFLYLIFTLSAFLTFLFLGYDTFWVAKKKTLLLYESLWFEVASWKFSVCFLLEKQNFFISLVVLLISFLVQIYSISYIAKKSYQSAYFRWLFFFTFCMIAFLFAQDLFLLFCFWELLGLCSFALIGIDTAQNNKNGKKAVEVFLYNRLADVAFIAALGFLIYHFKTTNILLIKQLFEKETALSEKIDFFWLSMAFMIAAFGKSAQLPFSAWLPKAMVAPTPISALLHAATMVVSGIFLLGQVFFILEKNALIFLFWIAFLTLIVGNLFALFSSKIKGVLAGSTVAQLALMVFALALGAPWVALFHLLTHAFFKALLFLVAGSLMKKSGEDKLENLKGIFYEKWKKNKTLVFAFILPTYGLLGLPFSAGFLSKEALVETFWQEKGIFFTFVFMAINLFSAFYMGRLAQYLWSKESINKTVSLKLDKYEKVVFLVLLFFCSFLPFSLSPFLTPEWIPTPAGQPMPLWVVIFNVSLNLILFFLAFRLIVWNKVEKIGLKIFNFFDAIEKLFYLSLHTIQHFFAYFDEKICSALPLRLATWQFQFSHLIQEKVETTLTSQPEKLGKAQVVWGHLMAWVDKNLVDALVLLFSLFWKKLSWTLGLWQTKRVQFYLLWGFILLISMIFIFVLRNKI